MSGARQMVSQNFVGLAISQHATLTAGTTQVATDALDQMTSVNGNAVTSDGNGNEPVLDHLRAVAALVRRARESGRGSGQRKA